jgi:hypothetical protein
MGGSAPQPQQPGQQPIPVPPFGQPGVNRPQAPMTGGMKGGSLAGIPDLATLFNAQGPVFPNSLSFPQGGQGQPRLGTPGGQIPGSPVIPAVPLSPMDRIRQMLLGGGGRELERGRVESVRPGTIGEGTGQ